MDVQVADSGPCRKTLTIAVPVEEIRVHLDQAFKSASQQIELKGFRKGKVPRNFLEKKFGEAIRAQAKEALVNESLRDACREHEIMMVGRPEVDDLGDAPLDSAEPLEFTVHLEVRPQFEVGEVKGIEVKAGSTEVTDEEMDGALQQIAEQKKTLLTVDEPVSEGDFLKANLTFTDESGAQVSERKDAQLNTGIPVAGTNPEEFSGQLTGTEKGQSVELEMTYPDQFEVEAVRGKKGKVGIEVVEVLRVIAPEMDDELAKSLDFDDVEALRKDLRTRIGEEKERANKRRQEEDVIDVLLNDHPFELPNSLVEEQSEIHRKNYREQLKERGAGDDEIEKQLEEAQEEIQKDAQRRVRLYFLLEGVARKEKIFVTETDVDVQLRNIAAENNVPPEQVREYFTAENRLGDLRVGIMERKVREFLRENANITD